MSIYYRHAFKPSAKASLNRNMFMKYALAEATIPDVEKGESMIPLVEYRISHGNLGLDALCLVFMADPSEGSGVFFNIKTGIDAMEQTTVAEFSTTLLENNPQLVEGQELTFLAISAPVNQLTARRTSVISFVLDKNNTLTKLSDLQQGPVCIAGFVDGKVFIYSEDKEAYSVLAVGLIISSKTASSWRYTNSKMVLSAEGEEAFEAVSSASVKNSYRDTAASRESDKILQQADN